MGSAAVSTPELERMQTAPGVFDPSNPPGGGQGMVMVPQPRLDADGRLRPLGDSYVADDTGRRIQVYDAQRYIPVYRVSRYSELTVALASLTGSEKPVISLVGGAGDFAAGGESDPEAVYEQLVTSAARHGGILAYGATDSGALAKLGQAKQRLIAKHERESRAAAKPQPERRGLVARVADRFRKPKKAPEQRAVRETDPPLIGFAAVGTIAFPGEHYDPWAKAPIQPDQDGLVLLPGDQWGAESRALAEAARQMAGRHGSVTVLINGGGITVQDALNRLDSDRSDQHLFVYKGSGRAADRIAAAREAIGEGRTPDDPAEEIARIAADPRVKLFTNAEELAGLIDESFAAARASARGRATAPRVQVPSLSTLRVPEAVRGASPAAAHAWGRMLVEGSLWESDGGLVTSMPGGDGPEVRDWMRASKHDRDEALARLREESRRLSSASAGASAGQTSSEQAFRDGARLAYFSALDAIADRPATGAALTRHTEPLTPTAPEPPRVFNAAAARGFPALGPVKAVEFGDVHTQPPVDRTTHRDRDRGSGREPSGPTERAK